MIQFKKLTAFTLFIFSTYNYSFAQYEGKATKPLEVKPNGTVIIDTFENDPVGGLPQEWWNQNVSIKPSENAEEAAKFRYFIEKEGSNKFLKYSGMKARHLNFPLRNRPNLNIYETPILTWKWKVTDLPEGANEDKDDKNDTAASIYVVFDMGHVLWKDVPKSIRYTWSSTLPEGTILSQFFDNQKIIVVESGPTQMGKWMTFEQNIVEDYKRLFGDPPPKKPLAILILSDGDSVNDKAVAAYDDIKLMPAEGSKSN